MTVTPSTDPAVEPGALPGNPPPNGLPPESIQGPPAWGVLDSSVPPSFVSVQPVTLPAQSTLYRVFSYPTGADPYPSWEIGSWWTPEPIPQTEAAWRGPFAVEMSWNGGQYYVAWTVPQDLYVWQGPTALQPGEYVNGDPASGYYLPGGAIQVYIAPAQMDIGGWLPNSSPWDSGTQSDSSGAVAQAPAPEQSYAGLSQQLARLSALLQTIAAEGERKGVRTSHIRVQADGVARMQARVERYQAPDAGDHLRATTHSLTGLARHVQTYFPWSIHGSDAASLLRDIVSRAYALRVKA